MANIRVTVRLTPRASRDEVAGFQPAANGDGEELRVRVTAPPVEGRANAALERLLAKPLRVARGNVRVVAGSRSRREVVEIEGLTIAGVHDRLAGSG